MRNDPTDFLHIGEQKGYIEFLNERTTIRYVAPDKKYRFTDPEEQVRARFYVELIEHFQYSENRINLEVTVPRRTPSDLADIVVFQDDDKKDPFIVVECKKDEVSEAEFDQAIEQAFGNCNSLGAYYTVVVAGNTRRSFDVKNYKPGERTENIIADPPVGYGKVQEWRYLKGVPRSEPSVIERAELIRVLEKCHQTLWQGGKFAPTQAFDELAKILFIKIRDEKKARRDGEPYNFQIKTHEKPESVANRINALYQDAKAQEPEVFTENIEVDENRLFSVVNHLQGISLNQTDLDVKGIAFERFLGNFFKGEIGQFFTPREVVEFMVDMVTPHHEELVLDPACGSGGFLLHAMDYIRKQASDYHDKESREHYLHWHDFAEKRLFGIEVNDSIARVAKMNMIIHDDGHSNVISNDALVGFDTLRNQHSSFEKEKFDVILTNPPFGADIKQAELPYLENYELGKGKTSRKTEILFLERCFDFLKWETGKLAIILPDGILTNSSLQDVRDYIERHFQILAVVSLPQIAFSHYGAGVKTSILFLRKFSEQEYNRYQTAINQITKKNEAIYVPQIEVLEDDRRSVIAKGSPEQVDITETYRQQFMAILDSIDALNQKLNKTPTKTVQRLSAFFFPEIESTPTTAFELFNAQTARAELKAQMSKLNALEKEYKAVFKAGADPEWDNQIKTEYKEQIDAVREEWEDKNTEDIREWVRENANHLIFMAIAERIGYDSTGRKDSINELKTICEEYRKFIENPDFFRVSPDRENQIFLTYRGDILGRLDPNYIKNISYINNIGTRYPLVSLGSLLTEPPMYGANEIAIDGDPEKDTRYIRITDIDDHGYLREDGWKTAKKVEKKYTLDRNDLLFARTGTVGKTFIHKREDSEAIFAGYLIRFRFDETRINPHFVFYYTLLSRYRLWVQTIQRPSVQPNINSKEFKAFEIPLPPPSIQNHIVTIMKSAYAKKKQKEQEADTLLGSIDDYVLKILGIEIPHEKENNIENRVFTATL